MLGRLEWLEIEAPSLEGNALRGPARRPLLVYLPPGYGGGSVDCFPAVYFLHGFTGSARAWVNATPFAPTVPERLDDLIANGACRPRSASSSTAGPALGGTQWIEQRRRRAATRTTWRATWSAAWTARCGRCLARTPAPWWGKSSGRLRRARHGAHHPEVFAHLASHAGDAGFEYCYLPDFPKAAAALQGVDPEAWLERLPRSGRRVDAPGTTTTRC